MTSLLRWLSHVARAILAFLVDALLVVTTPLVEKNPAKLLAVRAPLVLSMARLVVLGFAVALLHQIWYAGVGGWPDATLSVSVVVALSIVGALERIRPTAVASVAGALLTRYGAGGTRAIANDYTAAPSAPSKFVDRRSNDTGVAAAGGERSRGGA
jgi:hypothetical protein